MNTNGHEIKTDGSHPLLLIKQGKTLLYKEQFFIDPWAEIFTDNYLSKIILVIYINNNIFRIMRKKMFTLDKSI